MRNGNSNKKEDYDELHDKAKRLEALLARTKDVIDKQRREIIPLNDFLYMAANDPEHIFRDIFQLFYDMIHHFVDSGHEEYPDSNESVGFVAYDCSKLFVEGCDEPFLADRLFANRFMNLVNNFRQGTLHNYIFIYEGPPGSGKSTFLNNILHKLECFTRSEEGSLYKIYWRLDIERLGGFHRINRNSNGYTHTNGNASYPTRFSPHPVQDLEYPNKFLEFSCPNHDHPILLIPKSIRRSFLEELIDDRDFKNKLFNDKVYEWVLKNEPCHVCNSVFKSCLDIVRNPLEVFGMATARKNYYNRQFGEGISIFNPGDTMSDKPITNQSLQCLLNDLLKNDHINYFYSYLAKTNNGVLALMDIKENNIDRLKAFHGIISDGIHKVDLAEERIKTLFMGLVNPEDKIHYEKVKSFQDRIITVNIPYILDYKTEVEIYKNKFGSRIESKFLPGMLENFAKIVISTRLDRESPVIRRWIEKPDKYNKYADKSLLLLKMDIYTGKIPEWLSEEDVKRFDRQMRKDLLAASEVEGRKGISGRQSINLFNTFFSIYAKSDKLITMEFVKKFFHQKDEPYSKEIPEGFIESLEDLYDYNVLQQVKESIYYFNEKQISSDIQNYLFAINFEPPVKDRCTYTGDILEITEEYFKNFEALMLGTTSSATQRLNFRRDAHNEYITKTLTQEIRLDGKPVTETEQYRAFFEKYTRNLKENALAPYTDNSNFRRAIIDYGTATFNSYDERLKREVKLLINNLKTKFRYDVNGSKQVAVYVLDKNLAKKY